VVLLIKLKSGSMAFQNRNEKYGMKLEHSGWNLIEKSGTDQDLK